MSYNNTNDKKYQQKRVKTQGEKIMSKEEAKSIKAYYREVLKNVSDFREYIQIADSAVRFIGDKNWGVGIMKKALNLAADDHECFEVFDRISSLRIYGRI